MIAVVKTPMKWEKVDAGASKKKRLMIHLRAEATADARRLSRGA
jgi:hypothetical protein